MRRTRRDAREQLRLPASQPHHHLRRIGEGRERVHRARQQVLDARVLCKATAVKAARAGATRAAKGVTLLPARATRVSRGAGGDEVSAELGSGPSTGLRTGLQMVGFAPAASGLRSGSRVTMALDESALVIALLD
jgi:molybdate transport system regulatory protein